MIALSIFLFVAALAFYLCVPSKESAVILAATFCMGIVFVSPLVTFLLAHP
jgi:hypothetical protein